MQRSIDRTDSGSWFGGFRSMPIPHEHGAWAMFFAPLLLVLAALRPFQPVPALLLIQAATGAFLGQNALMLLIRKRGQPDTWFWTSIYMVTMLGGGLPLLFVYGRFQLLGVGAAGMALFLYYARLMTRPGLKKQIRSEISEVLTVATLVMTGPAAYIVARGAFDRWALLVWAACFLYFCSSIFYVKMWFAAAKLKGKFTLEARRSAARPSLLYHGMLVLLVAAGAAALGGLEPGAGNTLARQLGPGLLVALLVASYAPIVARAFWGWLRLSPALPSVRRIGVIEVIYTAWFMGCGIALLQAAGV